MSPPRPEFRRERQEPSDSSSSDLASRIRHRDRSALDEALELYWSEAVRYASRWVESEDAKDLAQDAFLEIWNRASDWAADTEIRPLLFGIIRNLGLRQRRRTAVRAARAEQVREAIRPVEIDPSDEAEISEFSDVLARAIGALPRKRREIFLRSRQHGLSHREIAEELGISPQTVANQLSSALENLRLALAPFLSKDPPKPDLRIVRGGLDRGT
jgi:RNA polymerase sigma-70 factor, ECF subfamily